MATPKPKPKDYSAVTGWQPTPSNTIKNITSKTGVEVTEDLKIKFRKATECFLADVLLLDGQPRISEKKARLKKLINGTTKYLALLNDTDDSTLQTINEEAREYCGVPNLRCAIEVASGFLYACEGALNEITQKDKGGPGRKYMARKVYISNLAEIYFLSTGEKPTAWHNDREGKYGGEFLFFVETCLSEIGHPPDVGTGLGKCIKETLGEINV